ncbi:hypothetical protein GCM10014715_06420 [Streptomyces spiralis]|uniref:Uncharacterized protein n=1 Tax=Streptomyces spiralis TaxID=66376 RepID=A0A918ZJB4_9ACTN|nr:hypothetical protein GCM10014715_06420 [Streptomyces spiralis]
MPLIVLSSPADVNSKAWLAWSLQSQMSKAVPGVSTLPLTSRHRPEAELTRGAAGAGADQVGAVVSNAVSSASTHTTAAAGKRGLRAADLQGATDEGCILFLEYVGEGDRECCACSEGAHKGGRPLP